MKKKVRHIPAYGGSNFFCVSLDLFGSWIFALKTSTYCNQKARMKPMTRGRGNPDPPPPPQFAPPSMSVFVRERSLEKARSWSAHERRGTLASLGLARTGTAEHVGTTACWYRTVWWKNNPLEWRVVSGATSGVASGATKRGSMTRFRLPSY